MSKKPLSYKYPEQVILSVTSHGGIDLDLADNVVFFTVPEEMNLIKLSAVVPGVCNMVSSDDTEWTNNYILWFIDDHKEKRNGAPFLKEDIEKLADALKKEDEAGVDEVHKTIKQHRRIGEADPDAEQFVYHADKSYNVSEYNSGETVINKIYTRNDREHIETPFDLKINALNVIGKPDLIEEIKGKTGSKRGPEKNSDIHLKDIFEFLKKKGVKDVVLLDFSCSVFGKPDGDFTRPETLEIPDGRVRHLRAELLADGKYGGRAKKTRRVHKKRRSIKRKQRNKTK